MKYSHLARLAIVRVPGELEIRSALLLWPKNYTGSYQQPTRSNSRGGLYHWVTLAIETSAILAECISEVDSRTILRAERNRLQAFEIKLLAPVIIAPLWNLDPIGWKGRGRGAGRRRLCYDMRIFRGEEVCGTYAPEM